MFGSFINAVVWRIHEHKSIANDRSECVHCHHKLGALDLVPVLSWLGLGGKCRYCHKPISIQYPVVELATSLLFFASYQALKPVGWLGWVTLLWWLYLAGSLMIHIIYDLRWLLLPDVVTLPAIVATSAYLLVQIAAGQPVHVILGPILAAVLAGGGFYALAAVSDGHWMGGGDIKLVFLMGLVLGLRKLAVALVLGFNAAAIIAIILIVLKRRSRKDQLPFGPFLAGGTIVAMLYGSQIINWYLNLSLTWFSSH